MGSQLSWLEHTPDKREVDGPSPFEPTKARQGEGLNGVATWCVAPNSQKSIEPTKVLFRTKYGLKRAGKDFGLRKSGHMIAQQSYGLSRFEQDGKASTVVEDFGRLTTAQQDKKVFSLKGKDEYKGKFHNLKVKLMVKKHNNVRTIFRKPFQTAKKRLAESKNQNFV